MHHIHLNPLGGVAGDMFVAALLHALPDHAAAAVQAAQALAGVECRVVPHNDGILDGRQFRVADPAHHSHGHHEPHEHHHGHTHWAEIRGRLERADLAPAVRHHATGIFARLAEAEARVHGVAVDDVAFHEVGAADSVADIVAAAVVIAALGPATWSTAPLPAGSGQVRTAHGLMPVPAPATALLLEGFALHDDGIPGERVTPTGAAILRHLDAAAACPPGVLRASGVGFGTRRLPGLSNCLRALVFETAPAAHAAEHRELAMIGFEVDDQSGEDLAAGLDRIRAAAGVHDVVQIAAIGKKGRMTVHVQVLARPDMLEAVAAACFRETTTIGLRSQIVQGRMLPRRFAEIAVEGQDLRVKLVERPGAAGQAELTGKAESDHLLHLEGHAARTRLRRAAERQAEGA